MTGLTQIRRRERPVQTGNAQLDAHLALGASWQWLWAIVAAGILWLAAGVAYVALI